LEQQGAFIQQATFSCQQNDTPWIVKETTVKKKEETMRENSPGTRGRFNTVRAFALVDIVRVVIVRVRAGRAAVIVPTRRTLRRVKSSIIQLKRRWARLVGVGQCGVINAAPVIASHRFYRIRDALTREGVAVLAFPTRTTALGSAGLFLSEQRGGLVAVLPDLIPQLPHIFLVLLFALYSLQDGRGR
jgi:hypothetical protein